MRCLLLITAVAAFPHGVSALEAPAPESSSQGNGTSANSGVSIHSEALERLKTLPKPSEQKDLNTVELASAHRERAASMEEKTNGLWQSWLVSVCEGCGPGNQPFTDQSGKDYVRKLRTQASQGVTDRARYTYFYPTSTSSATRSTSLAVDLRNENIDQIRRDPNR